MLSRNRLWPGVVSLGVLLFCTAVQAQKALHNDEVSIGGFFQFTSNASGNSITDTPTKSLGGEAAFSHSYHPLLGWQFSYDYSRFAEKYTGQPFGYQHNLHVFSGDYYLHGVQALGFRPYAMAGISAVVFSPSLNGGQNAAWQARPGANFGAGVQIPLLTNNFGVELQYRGLYYKAPDFGQAKLTTNAWRLTSEPTAGIYVRF
jgi:opacity protein-like surface antigen